MPDPLINIGQPTTVVKPTIKLEDARTYAKQLTEKVLSFIGKSGYNPYLWLRNTGLENLNAQLAKETDDSNQALLQQVMAVEYSEPSIENLSI